MPVGDALLGRVVDHRGMPLDDQGPLRLTERRGPFARRPRNPCDVGGFKPR
jgi:flagellar biosynthesis/type III secretory pathway ATPase